jgi:hypothetical protein
LAKAATDIRASSRNKDRSRRSVESMETPRRKSR